jgi:hypothetical protein
VLATVYRNSTSSGSTIPVAPSAGLDELNLADFVIATVGINIEEEDFSLHKR